MKWQKIKAEQLCEELVKWKGPGIEVETRNSQIPVLTVLTLFSLTGTMLLLLCGLVFQ